MSAITFLRDCILLTVRYDIESSFLREKSLQKSTVSILQPRRHFLGSWRKKEVREEGRPREPRQPLKSRLYARREKRRNLWERQASDDGERRIAVKLSSTRWIIAMPLVLVLIKRGAPRAGLATSRHCLLVGEFFRGSDLRRRSSVSLEQDEFVR